MPSIISFKNYSENNFEALKESDSSEILNNDCHFIIQAIKKIKIMRVLSHHALTKPHLSKIKLYFRLMFLLYCNINPNPGP